MSEPSAGTAVTGTDEHPDRAYRGNGAAVAVVLDTLAAGDPNSDLTMIEFQRGYLAGAAAALRTAAG